MRRTAFLIILCACGDGSVGTDAPDMATVTGIPSATALETMLSVEAPAPIDRIGIDAGGSVLVTAAGRVYQLDGAELVHRNHYARPDEPIELGEIFSIGPRAAGGAWIAAANGLFALQGLYVAHVPLPVAGPVHALSEIGDGRLAGTWFATDDDLYRDHDDAFTRLSVSGFASETLDVAVEGAGGMGLALFATELALLEPVPGDIQARELPDVAVSAIGSVGALGGGFGQLWASGSGLLRWRDGDEPLYTYYTLATESVAAPARSLAVDPVTGAAWVRTDDHLTRVDGDAHTAWSSPDLGSDAAAPLALDRWGDLWTADAQTLVRLRTGELSVEPTSYGDDVSPWLDTHCSRCHDFHEDYTAFAQKSDEALARVRRGDMPRCDGAKICSESERLTAEEWTVLETWIRIGKPQ